MVLQTKESIRFFLIGELAREMDMMSEHGEVTGFRIDMETCDEYGRRENFFLSSKLPSGKTTNTHPLTHKSNGTETANTTSHQPDGTIYPDGRDFDDDDDNGGGFDRDRDGIG